MNKQPALRALKRLGPEEAMCRVLRMVKNTTKAGCWETSIKYQTMRAGYAYTKAHRVALWANTGHWPAEVMHKCDNPKCVNPYHLVPGTRAENVADRRAKGRYAVGGRHHLAKLVPPRVAISIVEGRRQGLSLLALSKKYAVSRSTCNRIVSGVHWCSPSRAVYNTQWEGKVHIVRTSQEAIRIIKP